MAGLGVLTVKINADTKGLLGLTDAMLKVQREILASVNRLETAIIGMGNVSAQTSQKMASANKAAQESIRAEINKTAQVQQKAAGEAAISPKAKIISKGSSAITGAEISNVLAEKEAIKRIALEHDVSDAVVREAIRQRITVTKEQQKITQAAEVEAQKRIAAVEKENKAVIQGWQTRAQKLRTFGYLATATVTAPMVLAGKSSMNMAKEYEYAMQKIVGLTGTAQNVVNQWSKELLDLGKSLGRTPQELAEGLYFIASSGIKGADAMNVLKASAQAAAAGLGDTKTVADYITSALNAYRGTGLTAAYATDVLVAAVREGKAEATGFASAMGSVLPIASKLGVSVDQVAGSMAAVTLTGSTAAQAATYLRQMLNGLMKGSAAGGDALEVASGQIEGMAASYEDLRNILKQGGIMALMEKLKQLQEKYGESIVSKVFPNIRAMQEVFALTGNNMKYQSELMQRVTNSTGSLGKAFDAVSNTIKVRYDRAVSSANDAMISFGKNLATTLLPLFEKVVNGLNKLVNYFNNLSEGTKSLIVKFGLFVTALGPLSLAGSLVIYTISGMVNIYKALAAALGVATTAMKVFAGQSVIAGTKFSMLRKLVTIKSFFKGGIFKALLGSGAEVGGLVTLLGIGTVKVAQFYNQAKKAAAANDLFNSTMISVNDSLVEFNKLSKTDMGEMSLDQLVKAREQARQVWSSAYAKYQAAQKNKEDSPLGWNPASKKAAEQQLQYVNYAKKAYEDLGTAIDAYYAKWQVEKDSAAAANLDEIKKKAEELKQGLSTLWNNTLKDLQSIETMDSVNKALGIPFDAVQEKANLLLDFIKNITSGDYRLSFDDSLVKKAVDMVKELGVNFSEVDKKIKDFDNEIEKINAKKVILGDAFDADSAKLEILQNKLDTLVNSLMNDRKNESSLYTSDLVVSEAEVSKTQKLIDKTLNEIDKLKNNIETAADQRNLQLLQNEAEVFGDMSSKVEYLNARLQAAQRSLRSMIQTGKTKAGTIATIEDFKKAAEEVKKFKLEYEDAQNSIDTQYFNDLNNVLNTTGSMSDILSNKISVLQNKLKTLSEMGMGSSDSFKAMAAEMQKLQFAQDMFSTLSDSLSSVFDEMIAGGRNMQNVLKDILNNIIKQITAAIAKMIAMKIIMAIFNVGTGGAAGAVKGLFNVIENVPNVGGGNYAANGGIVPPGYPNDTYPAMLTSNEAIIPLQKLKFNNFGSSSLSGEVRFEIEGDRLVGILKKQSRKNSLY